MSQSRKSLAQAAVSMALKVRNQARCGLTSPICVFDLCERLDVSVFFQDIPSMEGIYMPDARPKPAIIVSSLRPSGRQAMTCGHELGHHVFGHGKQWDELVEDRTHARRFEPEEFQADLFSAALHMPKSAVSHAASQRGLTLKECSPETVYALSTLFGVSYGGFVTHAERTLGLIDMGRAAELLKQQPKNVRASILGEVCPNNLIVVDRKWRERAIDVRVGDLIALPPQVTFEGDCGIVVDERNERTLFRAERPGIGRVNCLSEWSCFIRVMRTNYIGLSRFRFDEEVADED